MAATRGPASLLPRWIQFLRLWKAFHNVQLLLGPGKAGNEHLAAAVTAFRSALEIYTQEQLPHGLGYDSK